MRETSNRRSEPLSEHYVSAGMAETGGRTGNPPSGQRYGSLRIRAYCTCGAKLDAFSDPPEAAEEVHRIFRDLHLGKGHAPCDAATARRARAKSRRSFMSVEAGGQ